MIPCGWAAIFTPAPRLTNTYRSLDAGVGLVSTPGIGNNGPPYAVTAVLDGGSGWPPPLTMMSVVADAAMSFLLCVNRIYSCLAAEGKLQAMQGKSLAAFDPGSVRQSVSDQHLTSNMVLQVWASQTQQWTEVLQFL